MRKPKFKEIKKKLNIKIFPYSITIIVSNDVLRSRSKYDYLFGRFDNNHAVAIHTCGYNGDSYIFLPHGAKPGVIAHECFHAVWELMEFIGANHNNEVMAYLMYHLVQSTHEFIKEKWAA